MMLGYCLDGIGLDSKSQNKVKQTAAFGNIQFQTSQKMEMILGSDKTSYQVAEEFFHVVNRIGTRNGRMRGKKPSWRLDRSLERLDFC